MTNPTSNYNFQMPTATDLVTDLPADFEVFGQAVDTRLKALQPGTTLGDLAYSSATANTNTRLGIGSAGQVLTVVSGVPAWSAAGAASAMTYVGGATFSGSSSQSLNNVFTSTYQNYAVLVNLVNSSETQIAIRFRVSGSDNTTSNYNSIATYTAVSAPPQTDVGRASASDFYTSNVKSLAQSWHFLDPQLSAKTTWSAEQSAFDYSGTIYTTRCSGMFNATTVFDGFTVFPVSGTFTGQIRVYGIANS